jgi:hypothetical protein
MVPGIAPVARSRLQPTFVGVTSVFSSDPSTVAALGVGPVMKKRVHFGISWSAGTNRSLDTVTFGGAACAREVRAFNGLATGNIEWWSLETSLASGDLVMDWSGGISGGICAVFWAPRFGSLTTSTGTFADVNSGGTISTTCDAYANGYLLAGARWGATRTTTWTGATEVYDASGFESFAMLPLTAAETGRTITATLSSAASLRLLAVLAVR